MHDTPSHHDDNQQHVKFQINWISNIGDMARTRNYYEILIKGA